MGGQGCRERHCIVWLKALRVRDVESEMSGPLLGRVLGSKAEHALAAFLAASVLWTRQILYMENQIVEMVPRIVYVCSTGTKGETLS